MIKTLSKTLFQKKSIPVLERTFLSDDEFGTLAPRLEHSALRVTKFNATFHDSLDQLETVIAIPSLTQRTYEVWNASDVVQVEQKGMKVRKTKSLTMRTFYGHEEGVDIYEAAYRAYINFFATLKPEEKLLRMWNYIPKILDQNGSYERYHLFNQGRFDAWEKVGPKDTAGRPMYPAATGIGSHGGPIVVEALTTTNPIFHLQNPRQTPAHEYSRKYGERPPVFARATLHDAPQGEELYISGTASIVGEDAVWPQDPVRQAQETMRNIEILMGRDNLARIRRSGFAWKDLHTVRVYVKHPEELPLIQREVERYIEPKHIVYLHDDICRKEWLLEIEAVASR